MDSMGGFELELGPWSLRAFECHLKQLQAAPG
jgi:hypothetical protein